MADLNSRIEAAKAQVSVTDAVIVTLVGLKNLYVCVWSSTDTPLSVSPWIRSRGKSSSACCFEDFCIQIFRNDYDPFSLFISAISCLIGCLSTASHSYTIFYITSFPYYVLSLMTLVVHTIFASLITMQSPPTNDAGCKPQRGHRKSANG